MRRTNETTAPKIRIKHIPFGLNDPYNNHEYERRPRQPLEGDMVVVKAVVEPPPPTDAVSLSMKVNGVEKAPVKPRKVHDYYEGKEWFEFSLGRFKAGDRVEYVIIVEGAEGGKGTEGTQGGESGQGVDEAEDANNAQEAQGAQDAQDTRDTQDTQNEQDTQEAQGTQDEQDEQGEQDEQDKQDAQGAPSRAQSRAYSFTVMARTCVEEVQDIRFASNGVVVTFAAPVEGQVPAGGRAPVLHLMLEKGRLRMVYTFGEADTESRCEGPCSFERSGENSYIYRDSSSGRSVEITKSPFSFAVRDEGGRVLLRSENAEDGIFKHLEVISAPGEAADSVTLRFASESGKYFGFGERYNRLDQRGLHPDICVYNPYLYQDGKTYMPVPFFFTETGFGMFVNTPNYVKFDCGSTRGARGRRIGINAKLGARDQALEVYVFFGKPVEVIRDYLSVTGRPALPPKWAFGPWMSSNSWNTQREVVEQVDNMRKHDIPAAVFVIEAWSDEATFYIFNDARYELKDGEHHFAYGDFSFTPHGKWPDPKAMVDYVHSAGLRLVLWQIPVIKHFDIPENPQHALDEAYVIRERLCAMNPDGTPYRITDGWFAGSLLLDFTNPKAREWWFNRRRYLLSDLGVDGFKTDGGEFIFDDDIVFFDGSAGRDMRNRYPNVYVAAYNEFIGKGRITFSRAGFAGAQRYPLHWAGDQPSSFAHFRSVLVAGLSANISGIPFWGYDIGGFSGEIPTPELFIRSAEMAAFTPVMQFHSESRGEFNRDRSPWNLADRTGDLRILDIYRYYAHLRMNLLPYIYQEATHASGSGEPMMRPLFIDYPDDPHAYDVEDEYLFGRDLLVAPIIEENCFARDVYLPEGEWVDFWTGAVYRGRAVLSYAADLDRIPVFIRGGSVILLDLSDRFELGHSHGNRVDGYANLCFLVTGLPSPGYEFEDDLGNRVLLTVEGGKINASASGPVGEIHVIVPRAGLMDGPARPVRINGSNGREMYLHSVPSARTKPRTKH